MSRICTDPELHRYIAERIRIELARRKMRAAELARRSGMPQRTLSHALTSDLPSFDFTVAELSGICHGLGVTLDELLPESSPLLRRSA